MIIELIYERSCPNVALARASLIKALAASHRDVQWCEWERAAVDSPAHVRSYASPTVLVDGKDVAQDGAQVSGAGCRLYKNDAGQLSGAPPVALIAAALRPGSNAGDCAAGSSGWRSSMAAMPGIGVALLPKLACPACWPIYAGLLSFLELGFLLQQTYLLPLTAAFLVLTLGALTFRARARRGYGPLALGLAAAVTIVAGKFALNSNAVTYAGVAGLLAATLWNAWPARAGDTSCSACAESLPAESIRRGGE